MVQHGAEKREAAARLLASGESISETARQLGVARNTVRRWIAQDRQQSAAAAADALDASPAWTVYTVPRPQPAPEPAEQLGGAPPEPDPVDPADAARETLGAEPDELPPPPRAGAALQLLDGLAVLVVMRLSGAPMAVAAQHARLTDQERALLAIAEPAMDRELAARGALIPDRMMALGGLVAWALFTARKGAALRMARSMDAPPDDVPVRHPRNKPGGSKVDQDVPAAHVEPDQVEHEHRDTLEPQDGLGTPMELRSDAPRYVSDAEFAGLMGQGGAA